MHRKRGVVLHEKRSISLNVKGGIYFDVDSSLFMKNIHLLIQKLNRIIMFLLILKLMISHII